MGYGFVEYKKRSDALRAITELQVCQIYRGVSEKGITNDEMMRLASHAGS